MPITNAQKQKNRRKKLAEEGLTDFIISLVIPINQRLKLKSNPDKMKELKALILDWMKVNLTDHEKNGE